jgi:hypothetical protein
VLKRIVMFDDENWFAEEQIECDVLTLKTPNGLTEEQREAPIPKDSGLEEFAQSEARRFVHGVGNRVHGGIETLGSQSLHGFFGEVALREHHHPVTDEAGHSAMRIHPALRNLKHGAQKRCVRGRKLAACMVVSVKADREARRVFAEHSGDPLRASSEIMRNEGDGGVEIVLLRQAKQGFEIQEPIVLPQ